MMTFSEGAGFNLIPKKTAIRLYMLDFNYISDFIDVNGTVFGINAHCPGRILVGDAEAVFPMVELETARAAIGVKVWYDLCNNTVDSPRWMLQSTGELDDLGIFGSELKLVNGNMTAFAYKQSQTNDSALLWEVIVHGYAEGLAGIDGIGVEFVGKFDTSKKISNKEIKVSLSVNSTLFGNEKLRVLGNLVYTRNHSANGDVTLDLKTGFGHMRLEGAVHKDVPLGKGTRNDAWKFTSLAGPFVLGSLEVKNSYVTIEAIPRNVTNLSKNSSKVTHDMVGKILLGDAKIRNQDFLEGSGTVEWNGTETANVSLNFGHRSEFLAFTGELSFDLPLEAGMAQGSAKVGLHTSERWVRFGGTLTWCNNGTCGDTEYDHLGQPRFSYEKYAGPLACNGIHRIRSYAHGVPKMSKHTEMAAVSRLTNAYGGNGSSIIIEGAVYNWEIGPFLIGKIAIAMRCETECCVGVAVGQANVGGFNLSASTRFSSNEGFQMVEFTLNEKASFVSISASLEYYINNLTSKAYTLKGTGSVIFDLAIDAHGFPMASGTSNEAFGTKDVSFTYIHAGEGNATLSMEGTIVIADKTFDFDFVRVNQTCWSGDLKTGTFSVHIGCDGIVFQETLHFKQSFQYIDVDANGTFALQSGKNISGCKTTLSGQGSAVIDFKLGLNVPRINFRMSAVGCSKFFEGALMVGDEEMHHGMVLPLGHANLKIENLGAAVSYTKSEAVGTDPNLRVALVGTVGGGVQDKDKLDIILAFDQVNWMITGVVEGPISLAGIISQVAPGVSLSKLDPDNHLGVIHDALLFASESSELLVAFKITAFGVDCTAQMTVGGDKIKGGSARVTVFIEVNAQTKDLPEPLDKLSLLFGNPADEVYKFLTYFDELEGAEEEVMNEHRFGGLDISKSTNTSEIHELLERAKRVSEAIGRETLPIIEGTGSGPGVLAAVKISSQNEKFSTMAKGVSSVAAFSDSLPKAPTFELVANFNWKSAELKLLLELVLTHNFTSSSQRHIGLRSLMLLADIKEIEVDFGFGISFLYHSVSNQSFVFE
ncbi:hypothetical protein AAMO2058_000760500, partial [Amorphochlora amoebiformis]